MRDNKIKGIGAKPIIGHPKMSEAPKAMAPQTGPNNMPQSIIGTNESVIRKSGKLMMGK